MNEKRITMVVNEAVRLLRENPDWTYKKAMDKAKEMVADEKAKVMEKAN